MNTLYYIIKKPEVSQAMIDTSRGGVCMEKPIGVVAVIKQGGIEVDATNDELVLLKHEPPTKSLFNNHEALDWSEMIELTKGWRNDL